MGLDPDHPEFGKRILCPDCGPAKLVAQFWRTSGVPEIYRDCKSFKAFQILDGTKPAFLAAREIAQPDSPVRLVVIYGPTGNGKTHLAYAAAIHSINKGRAAIVVRALNWLYEYKAMQRKGDGSDVSLYCGIIHVPFLILDELEVRTEFDQQTIDEIVCMREAQAKATLITTNYTLDNMEDRKFHRILSRASDPVTGRLVVNQGADYRKRGK